MATLNFDLRQSQTQRKKNSKKYMIMLRYSHQSKTCYFYTKKSIDIVYWDKKKQIVKRGYPGYTSLNAYLSVFKQKVEDIVNKALFENLNPTTAFVKDTHNESLSTKEYKRKLSFWEFVEIHIANCRIKLGSNTVRSYKNCINNIKQFENHKKINLDWHNIDNQFYHDFMDFYTNHKGLSINGFGKIIKVIKSILNEATEQGYNSNKAYKSKSFKTVKEDVDNIYLDEEELKKILDLDLTSNPKLERTRDLFILGCYTGLRFSDYRNLDSDNFIGNILRVRTEKTKDFLVIPLLPPVKNVLKKYDGSLPKALSNQKMNQYLKEIGELAELDQVIIKNRTSRNSATQSKHKKFELISTHTARRSFATNMYLRGLPSLMIMQITGHKTEESFMKYIKISKEENARLMLQKLNSFSIAS